MALATGTRLKGLCGFFIFSSRALAQVRHKKTTLKRGIINGGRDRDRTDDLLVANEALSQLSYTPKNLFNFLVRELLRTYLL